MSRIRSELLQVLQDRRGAEPVPSLRSGQALQDTGASADLEVVMAEVSEQVKVLDGVVRYRFGDNPELMGAWGSAHSIVGPIRSNGKPQAGGGETPEVVKPAA